MAGVYTNICYLTKWVLLILKKTFQLLKGSRIFRSKESLAYPHEDDPLWSNHKPSQSWGRRPKLLRSKIRSAHTGPTGQARHKSIAPSPCSLINIFKISAELQEHGHFKCSLLLFRIDQLLWWEVAYLCIHIPCTIPKQIAGIDGRAFPTTSHFLAFAECFQKQHWIPQPTNEPLCVMGVNCH